MSLHQILDRRRRALLAEWRTNVNFQVQVENPSVLGRLVFINDFGTGTVSPIGRRSTSDVVCVERAGNPDLNKSVWATARYDNYRKAFIAFLHVAYGVSPRDTDLAAYEIDHLLNRGRKPEGTVFIRLEAIPRDINNAWGRLYERALTGAQLYGDTDRDRRTLRWTVASKLAGQLPPDGPDDTAGIERLATFWGTQGLSVAEARKGLTTDLNRAFGRAP